MSIRRVRAAVETVRRKIDGSSERLRSSEARTVSELIDPIILAAGWQIVYRQAGSPRYFFLRNHKRGKGVPDYAFFNRGNRGEPPIIVIEAKPLSSDLVRRSPKFKASGRNLPSDLRPYGQLNYYFTVDPPMDEAGVGILTNGRTWRFYKLTERGRLRMIDSVSINRIGSESVARKLHKFLGRENWRVGRK